ncbi:MAG: restriction endonuclease subunit S [bacterium]
MTKLLEQINIEKTAHQISDLMEIKYGFGLPERNRVMGAIPVYASSGLVGFHNESKVKKPSIIIGRKGNVGSLSYSEKESYPIDTVFYVDEVSEDFDLKYVYYLLQRINLPRYGGDSAVPGLNRDTIYSISVETPCKETQKRIASILSAYDKKIENNNIIIKNLETTAQTIFNEWLIDFKFPGYENVKMVESDLGEIPEGWEVKRLDKIADFLNGVASQKYPAERQEDSFPVIKIREMNSGIDKSSDRATKNIDTKYIIKKGDILFAWSGSLSVMVWIGEDGILNQHIFKVTSQYYPKWFVYQYLQRHLQEFKAIAEGKATTMGHIQRHHISDALVLIPNESLLRKADKILSNLFEKQISLYVENISLRSQRDQLLAKLI